MGIRVLWDIYESVLLLHTYFEIESGNIKKKEAVQNLSRLLRQKAELNGLTIDKTFRNENGIAMQLSNMSYAISNGTKGLRCSSKIFYDAVDLYKNNQNQYESILREAIQMSTSHKTVENAFFEWLAPKVSSRQLSEFYTLLFALDEFFVSQRMVNEKLTELTDINDVEYALKVLTKSKSYFSRKSMASSLLKHYIKFLKENIPQEASSIHTNQKTKDKFETVDFDSSETYSYTRPVSLSFRGKTWSASAWKDIYEIFCKEFSNKYPANFTESLNTDTSKRLELTTARNIYRMTSPIYLDNGFYVESSFTTFELVRRMKRIIGCCGVALCDVVIKFERLDHSDPHNKASVKSSDLISASKTVKEASNPLARKNVPYKEAPSNKMPVATHFPSIQRSSYLEELNKTPTIVAANHQEKENTELSSQTSIPKSFALNFDNSIDVTFTNPVTFSYFEEEHSVNSWKETYISICKLLFEDYPHVFEDLVGRSILGSGQAEIGNEEASYKMTSPKEISDEYYIETNFSDSDLMKRVRELLDSCSVDYKNLIIRYISIPRTEVVAPKAENKPVNSDSKPSAEKERVAFIDWMRRSGLSIVTTNIYRGAFKACSDYVNKRGITDSDLLLISDTKNLCRIRDILKTDISFLKLNKEHNNRYLVAFNKYIEYRLESAKQQESSVPQPTVAPKKEAPEKTVIQRETIQKAPSPLPDHRFNTILKEHFPDGLRPNPLHLNKFKSRYSQQYGEELTIDRDALREQLQKIGSFRDGRIYAKQDEDQNELLERIYQEVLKTFGNGASIIYIECVFERYRNELASQLHVYNENALTTLIKNKKSSVYTCSGTILKSTTRQADESLDVLRIMTDSHAPLSYTDLQEKLWYIPLNKIKSVLLSTPTLVNVDKENYYYAPNLPVNAEEQRIIQQAFAAEIERRGFLVAADIKRILAEYCPSAAINTEGFTGWGLRNIFGYLFRRQFTQCGALICERGQILNMWDAYSRFCREYEQLTVEDLKQFSSELGSSIYWDAVLTEMVRISSEELVRKDQIHFDVNNTDEVLNTLCEGDYIPLHDISLFLQFPAIEVPWNRFVLESYLLNHSKKFRLYQASISQYNCYGIVVRSSAPYHDYESAVIDALAHSDEWADAKTALEWIVKSGFQARKAWSNFAEVVKKAALQREKLNDK